ncbi:MAG: signal peptidase I [Clostridia bacterium]|nr:signal peptidase I [Clostridia bacterium]
MNETDKAKETTAAEQPAENVQERPAAEQPAENVQERTAEEQPAENVPEKPMAEQPAKNVPEKPASEQPVENAQEKPAEGPQAAEAKAPTNGKKRRKGKNGKEKTLGQEILSWVWTLLGAVLIALTIRAFIFEPVRVDGHSMDDTLADGEIMFVSKFDYSSNWLSFFWQDDETKENAPRLTLGGNPSVNDVVVCRYPDRGDTNFVKRVVGLPGDTLELKEGVLYRNGEKQEEAFLNDAYRTGSLNEMNSYVVPKKGDKLTFKEGNGYYMLLLNGELWDVRNTRLFCKDPEGKDMIFSSRGAEIVYKGTTYKNSEPGFTDLLKTLSETEFTIDRDYFFLMGDHRNNSNDSRSVGAVDRSMIVGHVRQIVFPFNKWRGVK